MISFETAVNVPTKVCLDGRQCIEIAQKTVLDLVDLKEDDRTRYFIKDGDLICEDDYGHHRGGISTKVVRKATQLDKQVLDVVAALKLANKNVRG